MSEQDAGAGRPPIGRLRAVLGGGRARRRVAPLSVDPVITSRGLDGDEPQLRRWSTVTAGHLLRAAAVTGRTPGEVAARLTELGYRTPEAPPASAVLPSDRKLISWGHDGRPSWLAVDQPVSPQHILVAALSRGTAPSEVTARLGELGYRVAKVKLPAAVEPDDPVLISRDLDGRIPWLPWGGRITTGHLLRAAVVTRRTPAEVALRLGELGHRVPSAPPPDAIRPGDRTLMSRGLDGKPSWLSPGVPVEVERLLAAALAADSTPQRVAARLGELGYRIVKEKIPTIVQPHDTVLISRDLDGRAPRLAKGQRVTAGHLLRAAVVTGRTPTEVADRLRELEFRTADVPADDSVRPEDRTLISNSHDGKPPWLNAAYPVPLGRLLSAALATGTAPDELGARLGQLGYEVPEGRLPAQVEKSDLLLISRDLDGRAPWLPDTETVALGHLLRAAIVRGRTPAEIADRLRELGLRTPQVPGDAAVRAGDRKLISNSHDGKPSWLNAAYPVPLGWLLSAALATDTPPRQAAARLGELGYDVPKLQLPSRVEKSDLLLVSRDLDGRWSWLPHTEPIDAGHLLRAAIATEREVAEISSRLRELGFQPAGGTPALTIRPADRALISYRNDGKEPWLPAGPPVPLDRILSAALALDTSPGKVAARFTELGYELPAVQLPALVEPSDLVLISRDADGEAPWLRADEPVPKRHLQRTATATGKTREQVIARLEELGHRIA